MNPARFKVPAYKIKLLVELSPVVQLLPKVMPPPGLVTRIEETVFEDGKVNVFCDLFSTKS